MQQGLRHFLMLYSVPTDMAIALDTSVDGVVDGENGNVLFFGQASQFIYILRPTAGLPADVFPWPAAAPDIIDDDNNSTVVMGIALDF